MDYENLVKLANDIKKNAYAPYSNFHVGAALIGNSGKVYTGVNIENSSYGATICAERTAICKAISEGEKSIKAIAIASDSEDYTFPCGICRQVILEFADKDLVILCSNNNGKYKVFSLNDFLPNAFVFEK
ncbi:cytidine deaminase [Acetivibrio cellulolyticus]|uniref:cytidine deaminase n=1 Tax=Acetivibrio cellulolyticus TaxID=35830 RepID=UPI0001E2C721|nr:cytidine deaminase [Acetivibrio cellulolyticus]